MQVSVRLYPKQERYSKRNVTMRRVCVTLVAMEKHKVFVCYVGARVSACVCVRLMWVWVYGLGRERVRMRV
jgi:hypothetical protein